MLINLRNALMAGKRLPYDAEVEYLQSSGTQYIDTLVNTDSNLSVEITMANAGSPWTNVSPMGAILVVSTSLQTRHHLNFSASGVKYYYGNINNANVQTLYKPNDLVPFTFKVDSVNKIFTLGDYSTALPTYAFDAGLSYWLFGRNGTTPPYLGSLRIYSAKLWNGSVIVRDFIPVRVGTVGYLYDRVSGKLFGNAGTGDFVVGPDVVPVEYLQADGNSKLYSPISLNSSNLAAGVEIRMDAAIPNPGNVNGILCQAGGYYVSPWAIATKSNSPGTCLLYSYGKFSREFTGLSNRTTMVVEVDATTVYLTVGSTRSGGTYNTTYQYGNQLVIFGYDGTGSGGSTLPAPAGTRLYAYKIYVRNVLVADAIPIRVGTGSAWEGAMMDVLTRRIYRNAGTGAFGYGNDLKYPIPAE